MTEQVKIGKSAVMTTKLGLGTNKVGGHNLFPNLKDEDGLAVVKTALDHGIELLDTAFAYGLGRSEELIGQVIKHYQRDQLVIASKAAQDPDNDLKPNNDPGFLTKAVDDSLKRLGTDYLDIFYIHFPDEHTDKAAAVAALDQLKQAGKIRAIGVSNFSLAQLKEANQDNLVDIVEDNYSLVHRQAEKTLFPYLQAHQISFVPYFPLASGLLTGKYQKGQTFSDYRKSNPNFVGNRYDSILQAVEQIAPIAQSHEATVAQIFLAWYMQNPNIAVVIPGARKAEQVLANAKAQDIVLTAEEYEKIDHTFAEF